jgi:hypothetical protein
MSKTAKWAYWVYPLLSWIFAVAIFVLVDPSPKRSDSPNFIQKLSSIWWAKWSWFSALCFLGVIFYTQILEMENLPYLKPGMAFVTLGIAAGLMSIQPDMTRWQKAVWILILVWFGVIEFKSIEIEHNEHEQQFLSMLSRVEQTLSAARHIDQIVSKVQEPKREIKVGPKGLPSALVEFDHTELLVDIQGGNIVDPFTTGKSITVNIEYSNHSPTVVAHKVYVRSIAAISSASPTVQGEDRQFAILKKQVDNEYNLVKNLPDLLPGQGHFETVGVPALTQQIADELKTIRRQFYVMAVAKWTDQSGPHETELCSWLQPGASLSTGAIWDNCISGHNVMK